ncbi:hypothetical protein PCASD_05905 [Puccinia coronata f. sp. avenae]|uniref:Uncharacterized protein n=1 Tax=Puccinia coronata f. sp. avenae TaxID=200324 RepID=A0A2N5V650_9BASI|nr:hypothetical protein PCASD_05905 [Puccinia coronata f. sp. avenae]
MEAIPSTHSSTPGVPKINLSDDEEDAHDLIPSFESSGNHDMKSDDEEDTNHLPDFTNGELGEDDELTLADLEDIEPESVDDKYTLESCRQSLAKQTNSTSHQTQRQSS